MLLSLTREAIESLDCLKDTLNRDIWEFWVWQCDYCLCTIQILCFNEGWNLSFKTKLCKTSKLSILHATAQCTFQFKHSCVNRLHVHIQVYMEGMQPSSNNNLDRWQHSAVEKHTFTHKEHGQQWREGRGRRKQGREMRNGTRSKEQRQEKELSTYQVDSFVPFHLPFWSILSLESALWKHSQLRSYNHCQAKRWKNVSNLSRQSATHIATAL